MEKKFLFVDYDTQNIEGKDFFIIYILEYNKRQIFKIYKQRNAEILKKLDEFKFGQNITHLIDFVIRRDNKIALNINL